MDTFRILLMTLFISTFISCDLSNSQNPPIDSTQPVKQNPKIDSIKTTTVGFANGKQQYVFIVNIHKKNDTSIIDTDFIQYLSGQAAIDAAIKAHQADTFKTADGKTHIDVPNDNFIVNDNKKIRSLTIDKNCVIDLIINLDRIPSIKDNSLSSLKKVSKDSPFILTLDKKNVVLGIKEVFVP